MRAVPAIVLAVVCTVLPIALQCAADRHSGWLMVDFRAYYCAALARREDADPYYAAPLHQCESRTPAPFYRAPAAVTVPAPYPPYVLALLAPLTLLPFGVAAVVWWLIFAIAIALAAYAISRMTAQPLLVGWAVVGLSLGLTCFAAGNAMPVSVAAVVLAALCAQRGKLAAAALAVTLGMIEPQIALPAVVGLFVGFRSIRLTLAFALLALGAISVGSGGFAHNVAYFTSVLPAHALSEVSRDNQYSLSTVLAAFGVADRPAALAGSVSYLVMLALGVVVGLALSRRYREPAFIPLVPCAFALLGGSFVHTEAIAAAAPAALLLYIRAREHRGWLFVSLVLLAVPWIYATSAALFFAPLYPVAYLTYVLWRRDRAASAAAGLAAAAVILGLFAFAGSPGHVAAGSHSHPPIDPRLAEASWREFVLGNSTNRPAMWLLRLPTWAGLIGFVIGATTLSRASPAATGKISAPSDAPTLAGLDVRSNAIGFLRFFFAAAVIWSHAFGLGGFGYDPIGRFSHHALSAGLLAVGGFFVLSGFLIARSYDTTRSFGRFIWHRFLRIFPGYWVCLAIVAFGFASLAVAHDHRAFSLFSSDDSAPSYVLGNSALFTRQEGVSGLLAGLPFPFVFNGSLWTLQYEFLCYLGIAVLGLAGVFRRAPAAVAALSLWLFFVYAGLVLEYGMHGMPIVLNVLSLFVYFGFGACAYLFRERIPMRGAMAAVACAVLIAGLGWQPAAPLVAPSMAYLTLYAAMNLPVRSFDRRMDLSYGLYIYAFPVAQLLTLYRTNELGFLPYFAAGFSIAIAFAAASWFGVERPCLSLKDVALKAGAGISAAHQRRVPESR